MSSDEQNAALAKAEYWDKRYGAATGDGPTHEWFQTFESLLPFFEKHLFPRAATTQPRILHLGSGDSTIPYDLQARGYTNQLCVDFSSVVVARMQDRHMTDARGVTWQEQDVRSLTDVSDSSVDIAFDKGTLDAMIHGDPWSPPEDVMENSSRYMQAVSRVLKPDGVFLYITYRQPHFVKPILNGGGWWQLEMEVLGGGDSFEYFGFILRKAKATEV